MYFVTVMDKCEPNEQFIALFGDSRCWGYYEHYDQAVMALRENRTDLHEGCYNYAVIEKFGPGIVPYCEMRQWFKWDKEANGYREIDEPECVAHITNFAIG